MMLEAKQSKQSKLEQNLHDVLLQVISFIKIYHISLLLTPTKFISEMIADYI